MSDIGGISGFNPATTRSTFDPEAAAQRRAEERARQEAAREEQAVASVDEEEAQRAEESDAEQRTSPQAQQELQDDTVTLSNAAQDFLIQTREDTQAANDDAEVEAIQAAREAAEATGIGATNQTTRNEESTSEVNGNQDNQSEQTRALGQLVDQFA